MRCSWACRQARPARRRYTLPMRTLIAALALLPNQVNNLVYDTPPLERAVTMLEALDIDPYADDAWVDFLDIDLRNVPLIGPAK